MDSQDYKRKAIISKYELLKRKVQGWEHAIFKTEGRKPGRDDMKLAPKDIQDSYREFVKIRKYLEDEEKTTSKKTSTILTPGKIFSSKRWQQRDRISVKNITEKNKAKINQPKSLESSMGLRSSSNKPELSSNVSKDSNGHAQFRFKKLFEVSDKVPSEDSNKSRQSSSSLTNRKPSNEKILIGTANCIESSSQDSDFTNTSDTNSENHLSYPGRKYTDCSSKSLFSDARECFVPESDNRSSSANLPANIKVSSKTPRNFDPGWLARLDMAEDKPEVSHDSSEVVSYCIDSEGMQPDALEIESAYVDKHKHNDIAESHIDTTEQYCITGNPNTQHSNSRNSNSESCVMFNVDELEQAVQEVLIETNQNASIISGVDGSLLHSFSEHASCPSSPEKMFDTIDQDAISNIIKSLSDSDDNVNCLTSAPTGNNVPLSDKGNRKRIAATTFSPSSDDVPVKRKFFKTSRGERKAKYSTSFKPHSPVKKVKATYRKVVQPPVISNTVVSQKLDVLKEFSSSSSRRLRSCKEIPDSKKTTASVTVPEIDKTLKRKARILNTHSEQAKVDERCNLTSAEESHSSHQKQPAVDIFDDLDTKKSSHTKKSFRRRGRKAFGNTEKKELLESKMSHGKLNENYVRIDTKRKVFVRGHKKISAVKMKRTDWKQRTRTSASLKETKINTFACNKCGEKGHFEKFCPKANIDDTCPAEEDASPFPTLEEAARMVWSKEKASDKKVNLYLSNTHNVPEPVDTEELSNDAPVKGNSEIAVASPKLIESPGPYFEEGGDSEFAESTIDEALNIFGYESFRPGQREAVSRVLSGLSTLLILSTGSGKSLCYQLPAYLYGKKFPGALTLCVSPLVSLMEDQVLGIPSFMNAACLHSNMTAKQKSVVLEKVKAQSLQILLVSPEAICGGLFGLFKGFGKSLLKISFACIDEVHCVSQWSHNFRPSYLQICKILREKLNITTILGLTATATNTTAQSICEHLSIDPATTIRGELIPKNLKLSVSRDVFKDEALMNLLRGERLRTCDSIIIYCTRREMCERVATFVRTQLQEVSVHKIVKTKSGARLSGSCEAYHAGMTARRRKNVQDGFMSGEIRIVVATVAFGMGIDKSDIRAVIHYNMPSAFESYVQEIGRAGRDGLPAHCHLFLDNTNKKDLCELKRHVYANSVDRPTIRKLLRKVFKTCKCKRIEQISRNSESLETLKPCPGHEVSFSIDETVSDLDLPQENISTLLCYLELGKKKWIETLPLTYEICKIQSYGGAKLIKSAAARCPPLAVAVALQMEKKKFGESDAYIEFNIIEVAATVGWNSSIIKRELKNLEWVGSQFDAAGNPTRFRKFGLLVEFSNLAYRVMSPGSLSDEDADECLNYLHNRNVRQEQTQLYQLYKVYHALLSVSAPNINNLCDSPEDEKSDQLKKFIYEYFSEDNGNDSIQFSNPELEHDQDKMEDVRRSICHLIDSNKDVHFTTRSIARIFQGISSPCFPADVWYRNRDFWRKYMDVDFHSICRIASEEL